MRHLASENILIDAEQYTSNPAFAAGFRDERGRASNRSTSAIANQSVESRLPAVCRIVEYLSLLFLLPDSSLKLNKLWLKRQSGHILVLEKISPN